jgi:hypothetical protein
MMCIPKNNIEGCSGSGGHVAQCLYDGQHGSWFPLGDQLLVWFFLNQSAV